MATRSFRLYAKDMYYLTGYRSTNLGLGARYDINV